MTEKTKAEMKTDTRHTRRRSTRARERTAAAQKSFLAALRKGLSVSAAAEAAGVGRRTPYRWAEIAAFASEWQDAEEQGTDRLEDAAYRRAVHGTRRPVYQQGRKVGEVTEFSDHMTALLLKGRRPEKYGNKLEMSGSAAAPAPRDFDTVIGRARRVSYSLAVGAFAKAEQERGKRPALPAPAPEPVYRDATPAAEVRAQHPGATPEEPRVEHEINPRAERDSSGHADGKPRYWNPNASAHEMGREDE